MRSSPTYLPFCRHPLSCSRYPSPAGAWFSGRISSHLLKLNLQVGRNRLYDSLSPRCIYGVEGNLCIKSDLDYNHAGSANSQRLERFPLRSEVLHIRLRRSPHGHRGLGLLPRLSWLRCHAQGRLRRGRSGRPYLQANPQRLGSWTGQCDGLRLLSVLLPNLRNGFSFFRASLSPWHRTNHDHQIRSRSYDCALGSEENTTRHNQIAGRCPRKLYSSR